MRLVRWLLISGTLALLGAPRVRAEPSDPGFSESWLEGVAGTATAMAWAQDGSERLFVTTRDGSVFVVQRDAPGSAHWNSRLFTRVTPVFDNADSGLLGLAFDPDFASNHYVYFFVTAFPGEQQILRYTFDADAAHDKTAIVTGLPTVGVRRNGGSIAIGPDGKLYWGVGDNGLGRGAGAGLGSLASKIGRANLDGSVPNDNPFFDDDGPNADAIWARGVREPSSLSFQPATGALWVSVAGERYEQGFIVRRGDHAGDASYENDQPAGYLAPLISYRTHDVDAVALTVDGASRTSELATFTTSSPHAFRRGAKISIEGVFDGSFDGDVYVAEVPSPTTFTALQAAADAQSGGGTATTQPLGGHILGGTFYDATQFPSGYRGNYLFADYDSAQIMRAVLAGRDVVKSVDVFAQYPDGRLVDLEIGPDGALYGLFSGGELVRIAHEPAGQSLIVSQRNLWMARDSVRSIGVRLSTLPSSSAVVVRAKRVVGDAFIEIEPAALIFTPSNWNVAQSFTIARADDPSVLHAAKIDVTSTGLATEAVIVHPLEDKPNALVLQDGTLAVPEGQSANFGVALAARPAATTTVSVTRYVGSPYVSVAGGATLTFTPEDFSTPQLVTVAVADDPGDGGDSAVLTLRTRGFASRYVTVAVLDNDPSAPRITSAPPDGAGVGVAYHYGAAATGVPAPTFQLTSAPSGMTVDAATGALSWTPSATGTYSVTLIASNGNAPDAEQTFSVHVGGPLSCGLLFPQQGQVLAGTDRYFSGYGAPAGDSIVPVLEAAFLVDSAVVSTQAGPQGLYHFDGTEGQWDTTVYDDGPHDVGIRMTDAIGQTCSHTVSVTIENHPQPDAGTGMDAGPQPEDAGSASDGGSDAMIGPTPDAASDGAAGTDAAASDAGTPPSDAAIFAGQGGNVAPSLGGNEAPDAGPVASASTPSSGCGCRTAPVPAGRGPTILAAVLFAFLSLRRARAAAQPADRREHRPGRPGSPTC